MVLRSQPGSAWPGPRGRDAGWAALPRDRREWRTYSLPNPVQPKDGAAKHELRVHSHRAARQRRRHAGDRPDQAEPAQADERVERAPDGRTRPRTAWLRCRCRRRLHRHHRQRQGLCRRRRHRRHGRLQLHGRLPRQLHHAQLGGVEERAQAGDRGGGRLCARRRLRTGAGLRLHHRCRQRPLRPARDQARHHPWRRRHAAAAARVWARARRWT